MDECTGTPAALVPSHDPISLLPIGRWSHVRRPCGTSTPPRASTTMKPHSSCHAETQTTMAHTQNANPPIPQQVAANASLHLPHNALETHEMICPLRTSARLNVHAKARSRPRHHAQRREPPPSNEQPPHINDSAMASQGPLPPNANIASIALRRACPMARELLYLEMMDQANNFHHMVYMGACVTCGQPTGNFCDPCVNAGRTFEVPAGQIMAGSPICGSCEETFHCYVCVGIAPPGPIGQPTVPIVTLAPVMHTTQAAANANAQ